MPRTILGACFIGLAATWATMAGCAAGRSESRPEAAPPTPSVAAAVQRSAAHPFKSRMLGALPGAATSFLVVDVPALLGEGSAFSAHAQAMTEPQTGGTMFHPLTAAALRYSGLAGIDAYALAGSDFQGPRDLGLGSFNARLIFHAATALTPPAEWLDEAGAPLALTPHAVGGIDVFASEPADLEAEGYSYSGPPYAGERRFVAMADPQTVVVAESAEDAAGMALAWRAQREFDFRRFAPAFDPGLLDSPFVVLRDGLPESSGLVADGGAEHALMLAITDVGAPAFTLRYAGPEAERCIRQVWGLRVEDTTTDERGVSVAVLTPDREPPEEYQSMMFIMPALVFGVVFVI